MSAAPCPACEEAGAAPRAVLAHHDAAGDIARFDVSATFRGQSAAFKVFYDDALGAAAGAALADGVLARCDADYAFLFQVFGAVVPPLPMTCIVCTFPGAKGGGYHWSCIDNTLYVTGQTLAPPHMSDTATALAVLVAEEVEVFSAAQGLGWNCGDTNGEGLSRVLAEELYPGVLDYFHTADVWLDNGRPDYVANNVGNDKSALSNGCSVVFLYFLHYVLGYDWSAIVQAGGSTLEQTYQNLTGASGGYSALRQCVDALYPPGSPSGLTTDNPFPAFDYYEAIAAII
jgi:hypothetical protein